MKRLLSLLVILLVLCPLLLTPVLAYTDVEVVDEAIYQRFRGQDVSITVYNWGEYISDGSDDSLDVNAAFEKLTGIHVNYITFASNEQMYAKLRGEGSSLYDILVPSDYMIAKMIQEDMLEPLNFKNIPNYSLIDNSYKDMQHDPENLYSVPYMWGMVGLIYNTSMTDEEVDSWDALWDERYMGNILMFENPRDAFGIALSRLGYSMNSEDPAELEQAAEELRKQKMLVQAYVMDEIFNKMEGGEAIVAPYYAGDAITMIDENPDLAFVFPKERTNIFVDSFVIPKESRNKEAAELYINFLCEPEVSAANAEYIGYSTPIGEALALLDIEDEVRAISYPSPEIVENAEIFKELSPAANMLMDRLWTEVRSYNENANDWLAPLILVFGLFGSIFIFVYRSRKKKREG